MDQQLLIGDPRLYEKTDEIILAERPLVKYWISELKARIKQEFNNNGECRGIAAPQIGIMRRLMVIRTPQLKVMINPVITWKSREMWELWDECLSIPGILVKVRRHQRIKVTYLDQKWKKVEINCSGKISELIQHEMDHLEGILCTMRAINKQSFKAKPIHRKELQVETIIS